MINDPCRSQMIGVARPILLMTPVEFMRLCHKCLPPSLPLGAAVAARMKLPVATISREVLTSSVSIKHI
jgi:hypothetical protein